MGGSHTHWEFRVFTRDTVD
jgi:hypothetical protein